MGASGSGKSTMLNLLGCLDRPTSGQYILGDRDVARLDDDELSEVRSRYIGFIFQSYNLIQQYTVAREHPAPADLPGQRRDHRGGAASGPSSWPGWSAWATGSTTGPTQLSGGQQQRVAIARSLINDPYIILADEATGNLDTATSHEIMEMLGRLNDAGKTIIMVTHEDDIAEHAKRIIRMRDGLIIEDGPSPRDAALEPRRPRWPARAGDGSADAVGPPGPHAPVLTTGRDSSRSLTRSREEAHPWDASGAALKLGMKSLLLHKLRSGLTVLGIVFGVAAVISMLADRRGVEPRRPGADPGSSGRPTSSSARSSRATRPRPPAAGRRAILNYGLKYDDYDRIMATVPTIKKVAADPRDPQADPPPQLLPRRPRRRHDPGLRRVQQLEIDRGRFLTDGRQREVPELRRARRRDRQDPLPLRGPDRPVGQARLRLLHGRRRDQGARRAPPGIGGSLAAQDFNKDVYIPLNTCRLRFGERIINSRSGSMEAEETQLSQITLQVGIDRRGRAVGPDHRGRRTSRTTPRRTSTMIVPYDLLLAGPADGPAVQHHPRHDRRRSRCWSAASAS